MNKTEQAAVWLSAVGAINWGLAKFVSLDLIMKLPTNFQKIAYGIVAAAGAYTVYALLNKKI